MPVIIDIVMPGRQGTEIIMEMRHESPATKIMVMSGVSLWDECLKVIEKFNYGIALRKPIDRITLLEAIRKLAK